MCWVTIPRCQPRSLALFLLLPLPWAAHPTRAPYPPACMRLLNPTPLSPHHRSFDEDGPARRGRGWTGRGGEPWDLTARITYCRSVPRLHLCGVPCLPRGYSRCAHPHPPRPPPSFSPGLSLYVSVLAPSSAARPPLGTEPGGAGRGPRAHRELRSELRAGYMTSTSFSNSDPLSFARFRVRHESPCLTIPWSICITLLDASCSSACGDCAVTVL